MKKLAFAAFLTSINLIGQAQNSPMDYNKTAIQSSKYWLDVDYVGDRMLGHRLDVHLPKKGKGPYPIIVAIYGSAWFSNSSKGVTFQEGLGQVLLNNGFAVVSINHRSSGDAKFPAQIQDVKAAIRFIRANAPAFNLAPDFIGVTGWSSGGHLSALTGTSNNVRKEMIQGEEVDIEGTLGKHLGTSSAVDAVVDWFGPTDFLKMDDCGSSFSHNDAKSPESSLVGGPIQENKEKVATANPISYVKKSNPPFLIFHGDKDPLVPHCQSQLLFEQLQAAGVSSKLVIIPEGGHGPGVLIEAYFEQMIQFFKLQLKSK